MPWNVQQREGKWVVVKKDTGAVVGTHASEEEAMAQMKALYAKEGNSYRVAFEPFAKVANGDPIKLMPIGKWHRGDRELDITKTLLEEVIANFEAGRPLHKVGIDLDHAEGAGKVGDVTKIAFLEGKDAPRGDGLYITDYDMTEKGVKAVTEDGYDAVSAEIVWSIAGAKYQDPRDGVEYDNVLTGVALTPRPFFGRDVAIYSEGRRGEGQAMPLYIRGNDIINPPKGLTWGLVPITSQREAKMVEEELVATKAEAERLAAENKTLAEKLATVEAERKAEHMAARHAALKVEAEGYEHLSVKVEEYVEKFSALEAASPELAEWVRLQFNAYDKASGAITTEIGVDLEGMGQTARFTTIVGAIQKAEKLSYEDALRVAIQKHPEMAEAYVYDTTPTAE